MIDFGIARVLDATSTITSQVIGTPAFMSPEQINGEELGPPSDMFAWGSTIVYAGTGASPFGGDTIPAIMNRIMNHEPDLDALTGPLRQVVAAALSKDPARRPTPREVLDLMLSGGAAPTDPISARRRPSTPPKASAPPLPAPATTSVQPSQVATAGLPPTPGPIPTPGPAPAMPLPPARSSAGLELIGPGLGSLVGLYLLSVTTGPGWMDHARLDLGLAGPHILLASIAYLVAAGLSAPIGVVLGRRYPNRVAATSAGLMLVGVLLNSLAPTYTLLMVGRIMSGLGAGVLLAEAVVLALRAGRGRTSTIGLVAGLGTLALALGPLLGQVLVTTLAWRWAFLISVPLIILALLATIASGIILVTSRPENH